MLDAARSTSLSRIPDGPVKEEGLAVGEAVAGQIVALAQHGRVRRGRHLHVRQRSWRVPAHAADLRESQHSRLAVRHAVRAQTRRPVPGRGSAQPEQRRMGRGLQRDEAARKHRQQRSHAEQTEIALCDAEPALPMWNRVARSVSAAEKYRPGRERAVVRPAEPGHGRTPPSPAGTASTPIGSGGR